MCNIMLYRWQINTHSHPSAMIIYVPVRSYFQITYVNVQHSHDPHLPASISASSRPGAPAGRFHDLHNVFYEIHLVLTSSLLSKSFEHAEHAECCILRLWRQWLATGKTLVLLQVPVTVAERPKVCTVFARSTAGIVGSNPTQGMDDWYVYVFILFVLSCV
jgi:hypothetical protein